MMIDNISTNQMGQILPQPPMTQSDPAANTRTRTNSDVALQIDFASLVDQAKQAAEPNASDVQKARELLLSGELTSPENIRSAATNMLKSGI
jgi:hypothetical protein